MAQNSSGSRNAWIIAGAIVLTGLIVVIALTLLLGGDDGQRADGQGTGSETITPSQPAEPSETRSPRPSRSPRPEPTESPSPSPSPAVDPTVALRAATQKQAERDRPGEVKHVGQVEFFDDPDGCPQTGEAASVFVRFVAQPKFGIYIWCEARVRWKYHDGPIYGE